MILRRWAARFGVFGLLVAGVAAFSGCTPSSPGGAGTAGGTTAGTGAAAKPAGPVELLNVSYDPTRELWAELNKEFIAAEAKDGRTVTVKQSHGGSSSQARAVIDGLEADVVTLAMWNDVDAIAQAGLIDKDWEGKLPHKSLPYYSTIVFVVRKGNPKKVKDWSDLVSGEVKIITPNPKTSGNGKLSFLGAWGYVLSTGGDEAKATEFVTKLYQQVPILDSGARGATATFAQKGVGDVHLTWENEAYLEVAESKGELEIVYPSKSIKAEPNVALVDKVAAKKGSTETAKKYLEFVYTPAGQEIVAKHYYRPNTPEVLAKFKANFKDVELFDVTKVVPGGWKEAQDKFFAEGAVFDKIFEARKNN